MGKQGSTLSLGLRTLFTSFHSIKFHLLLFEQKEMKTLLSDPISGQSINTAVAGHQTQHFKQKNPNMP